MIHHLYQEQWLPASPEVMWQFFANPANLSLLTPPEIGVRIIGAPPANPVYPGQIIAYRLKPLWNIPATWVTQITEVVPLKRFVDEQRKGPYRLWHHEHHFEEKDGGVLMKDILQYQLPFGVLGDLVQRLLVRRKLDDLFRYRKAAVAKQFAPY